MKCFCGELWGVLQYAIIQFLHSCLFPVCIDTKQPHAPYNEIFQPKDFNVLKTFVCRKPKWLMRMSVPLICNECLQESSVIPGGNLQEKN